MHIEYIHENAYARPRARAHIQFGRRHRLVNQLDDTVRRADNQTAARWRDPVRVAKKTGAPKCQDNTDPAQGFGDHKKAKCGGGEYTDKRSPGGVDRNHYDLEQFSVFLFEASKISTGRVSY